MSRGERNCKQLQLFLLCLLAAAQVIVQPAACQAEAEQATDVEATSSRGTRAHRHRGSGSKPSHHGAQTGAQAKALLQSIDSAAQQTDLAAPAQHVVPANWEGGTFWMENHRRTLYFEPVAGLGNRLRALASAIIVAREFGVGVKMVWKSEPPCDKCGVHYAPFVSSWDDLFAEPPVRQADNFPGANVSFFGEVHLERFKNGKGHGGSPPDNCTIHVVDSYDTLANVLTTGWATVLGEEVVCAKGTSWLTRRGEYDAAPFFSYLRPAPVVQNMVDSYKRSVQWDTTQWICTHVRRTDLSIWKGGNQSFATDLISLGGYTRALRALLDLATVDQETRIFIATDDPSAEREIMDTFEEGLVASYPKAETAWTRGSTEGIQAALADIMLLSSCPVLVGTFYSSYSETAKLLGKGFYVQVGGELSKTTVVAQFERVRNSTAHHST